MRIGVRRRGWEVRMEYWIDADGQLRDMPLDVLQRGGGQRVQARLRLCVRAQLCLKARVESSSELRRVM